MGMLGVGEDPETAPNSYYRGGELAQAGVPFPVGKRVYHGTNTAFEKIRPGFRDNLIHAADDPAYAAAFTKSSPPPGYTSFTGDDVAGDAEELAFHAPMRGGANILPLELDVKNAIDLTPGGLGSAFGAAETAGDLRKIEHLIPARQMEVYKDAKRNWRSGDEEYRKQGQQQMTALLVDQLVKQNPQFLQNTGFDGIRYLDGNAPAWAVPDPNQVINALTKERGVGNIPGRSR